MNEEFRKKKKHIENNFHIPDGCFEHISLSNNNLSEFLVSKNKGISSNVVFTNSAIKESFMEYITKKELSKIDKICHISSLIILSPNKYDIEENDIFNFIHSLEDDFFQE